MTYLVTDNMDPRNAYASKNKYFKDIHHFIVFMIYLIPLVSVASLIYFDVPGIPDILQISDSFPIRGILCIPYIPGIPDALGIPDRLGIPDIHGISDVLGIPDIILSLISFYP